MFKVKILADSVNDSGNRLTTFELVYPEFIHNELLTHRMLSRNAMSSRAIPVEKLLKLVEDDPVVPIEFGRNQKGMQAGKPFDDLDLEICTSIWMDACKDAIRHARRLSERGVHKQIVNRILGPYKWINVIASATDWWHFFNLRAHPMAEPHMIKLANTMLALYEVSQPALVLPGRWHLPLIHEQDLIEVRSVWNNQHDIDRELAEISAGRCARVSYLTHHGTRDLKEDVSLCRRLTTETPIHASPLEHPARAYLSPHKFGNYTGWEQLRKFYPSEYTTEDRRLHGPS